MTIEPRKPVTPYNLGEAITIMFQTEDSKAFAWRLLFWTTAGVAITLLVTLPFILPHYAPLMEFNYQNMQAMGNDGPPPDPQGLLEPFMKMLPAFLAMMVGFWITYVAGEAALHRKVLLGKEHPKRPIRFGRDEFMVFLAQLGVWGLFFVIYIGGIFAIALSMVIPGLGVLLAILAGLAMCVLFIYMPVKLAPAAALSVYKSEVHLLAARHVTKFRFWQILGAYFIVFLAGYFLTYAVSTIGVILVTGDAEFMLALSGAGTESPEVAFQAAAERLKNPFVMFLAVISIILYAFAYAVYMLSMSGVGAYAVKWWKEDEGGIAPTFD